MLSDLKDMMESLENSAIFKKWKEKHKQAFLSSFFIVDEQGWQLAYYSPENDRVSTFLKDRLIQSDSAIFKLKQSKVEELELEKVKVSPEEAFNKADKVLEEKHPGYKPVKKIIILHNSGEIIWNITYLTTSAYIFNIKIDAVASSIISEDFASAMYANPKKNPNLL